jgi:hypothetical protein
MNSHCRYWFLSRPPYTPTLQWDKEAGRRTIQNVCPVDPAHNRSGKRPGELQLILPDTQLQDFAWTSYGDCLIQDRVLKEFTSAGFTGFYSRPVHLRREHDATELLPTLWELQITGWGGMARAESGVTRTERCPICGWQIYTRFTNPALLIDDANWDGSDFFMVWPMPRYVFIADRVASLIRSKGFTGADVIELSQIPLPRGFGPGGLRDWMPEERARKLGVQLDIY